MIFLKLQTIWYGGPLCQHLVTLTFSNGPLLIFMADTFSQYAYWILQHHAISHPLKNMTGFKCQGIFNLFNHFAFKILKSGYVDCMHLCLCLTVPNRITFCFLNKLKGSSWLLFSQAPHFPLLCWSSIANFWVTLWLPPPTFRLPPHTSLRSDVIYGQVLRGHP